MCEHNNKDLIGTAAGITCRACGKTWESFEALRAAIGPVETPPPPEEKPKRGKKSK